MYILYVYVYHISSIPSPPTLPVLNHDPQLGLIRRDLHFLPIWRAAAARGQQRAEAQLQRNLFRWPGRTKARVLMKKLQKWVV